MEDEEATVPQQIPQQAAYITQEVPDEPPKDLAAEEEPKEEDLTDPDNHKLEEGTKMMFK
jgi:hypothetical protein